MTCLRATSWLAAATLSALASCQPREASKALQAQHVPIPARQPAAEMIAAVAPSKPAPSPLTVRVEPTDIAELQTRALSMPVQGVRSAALRDTFGDDRRVGAHEALDIPAPMRAPVFAVEDGVVAKLFTSQRGGLTVYHFDPAARFAYYYAHLDAYAPGLREGQPLKRCALVGYVGLTGNSPAGVPHLHFAIFKLEAQPRWWRGAPLNPHPVLSATTAAPCPPWAGG